MRGDIALAHHPSGLGGALRLTVLRASVLQASHVTVALSPTHYGGLATCSLTLHRFSFSFINT